MATPSPVADLIQPPSAGRHYVERWGSHVVLNRWLTYGVIGLSVLCCAQTAGLVAMAVRSADIKPLVVRVDAVGRAEAVAYDAATWQMQTPELRYFLTQFVTRHYSRMRQTVARDYPASLLFLDGTLANSLTTSEGPVEAFVQNPGMDETDVEVKNVTFTNLTTPPYQASVDFVTRDYSPNSRAPRKTETFTAQVAFVQMASVPNALVPVNPLGLQITQLRVDQAFN